MSSARHLGPLSLCACIAGMVVMETLIHTGVCADPWWRVLAMAFEAGTIGGMADWFAVSALFRPVPIPGLSRHTNIIANNRAKIVDNLKDYVQNKLLTPMVIREKLAGVGFVSLALQHLDAGNHLQQVHRAVRTAAGGFVAGLERDEVVVFLTRAATERLSAVDAAKPLGSQLRKAIEGGGHHRLWEGAITESQRLVRGEGFAERITAIIRNAAARERDGGRLKKWFLWTAETTGGFDYGSWARRIAEALDEWLDEVKRDPAHGFRQEADGYLLEYAAALESGRADTVAAVEAFKQGMLQHADLEPVIRAALGGIQATLQRDLADERSGLSRMVASLVDGFVARLRTDAEVQALIDQHVRDAIGALIEKHHAFIGDLVGTSLGKISDRDLVAQIEDRIGGDLQYIRLNGAIVGGLVGALILTAKFVVFGP
jgi:uncharacterized membrane-anchored protein YjiN (DUF445 family)